MAKKGAYPKEFSTSAMAAFERYISRRAKELAMPVDDIPGTAIGQWLGISQSLVSKLRAGRAQMQMPTALRLAEELGVTLDDVMYHAGRNVSGAQQPSSTKRQSHITEKPRPPRKGPP